MFRALKITAIGFVVLLLVAALWINENNYRRVRNGVRGPIEATFAQGGTVTLDLRAGAYTIRDAHDGKIHVRYHYPDYLKDTASIALKTEGQNATLSIDSPRSGFEFDIEVPQKTDLSGHLTAGALRVYGIEGNKDLESNAGLLIIDAGDVTQYKSVDASVTSGNLQVRPWHSHKPGLFRSFRHHGSGPYGLRAHVTAGNLIIDGHQGTPPPTPPLPDKPSKPEPHFD